MDELEHMQTFIHYVTFKISDMNARQLQRLSKISNSLILCFSVRDKEKVTIDELVGIWVLETNDLVSFSKSWSLGISKSIVFPNMPTVSGLK